MEYHYNYIIPRPNGSVLTAEQIEWAQSIGITPERAQWLATCPAGTKCGNNNRPDYRVHNPMAYLSKPKNYLHWYFKIQRTGLSVKRKLTKDLQSSKLLRDKICAELGIELIPETSK